ncbi:hypothetical protein CU043_02575 [Corynebacterium striatum]|nr:hypothetical protein [Corynebacterium striatum]
MIDTRPVSAYSFRPGALEHIMRSRNLRTDKQLAAALGVRLDDLAEIRLELQYLPDSRSRSARYRAMKST